MQSDYAKLLAISSTADEIENSVNYLVGCLQPIVKKSEATLICFPREKKEDFGSIAAEAVRRCEGQPVFWEKDLRWSTLLRLAFLSKASTIIAPPLVVLGLSKLAAYRNIPLYFYNVVVAGYACMDWMMDGIEKGLDCKIWGVYGPGAGSMVNGFSCECGRGIHFREDQFAFEIVDFKGNEVPDGTTGRILVYHRQHPEIRFLTKATGNVMTHPCPCGNPAPKIVNVGVTTTHSFSQGKIAEELLYWYSILDCNIRKTEFGLELEIVCFQGEKLPEFPSCAKLVVRPWNPETDVPFSINAEWVQP